MNSLCKVYTCYTYYVFHFRNVRPEYEYIVQNILHSDMGVYCPGHVN
jgi:hypothetical protein